MPVDLIPPGLAHRINGLISQERPGRSPSVPPKPKSPSVPKKNGLYLLYNGKYVPIGKGTANPGYFPGQHEILVRNGKIVYSGSSSDGTWE